MTGLELRGALLPGTGRVNWAPPAGMTTVLGANSRASVLIEAAAGLRAPRRGRVLVDGVDPMKSPAVRRKVGALLPEEPPLFGRTVQEAVALALGLRGETARAESVLEAFGLGEWARRDPSTLRAEERQRLSLVLALSIPEPRLLALFEPLDTELDRTVVVGTLRRRASAGCTVLCFVANAETAAALGGASAGLVLRRGGAEIVAVAAPRTFAPRLAVVTSDPRALAEALVNASGITRTAVEQAADGGVVIVEGTSPEATSAAVIEAALRSGVSVESISAGSAAPKTGGEVRP